MSNATFPNREPEYKDLDLDFYAHPITLDISKKTGTEAIKRAIRNLMLTNTYEKPFQPYYGGNIRALLFENVTPFTAIFMQDQIKTVIQNFEPRVKLKDVRVAADIDRNGYNVTLDYIILNKEVPVTTTIFLERIR